MSVVTIVKDLGKIVVSVIIKELVHRWFFQEKPPTYFPPDCFLFHNPQGKSAPIPSEDLELGEVIGQFLDRCDRIRLYGSSSCLSYQQVFFMFGEQLKELESVCSSRRTEIQGFVRLIEASLQSGLDLAEVARNIEAQLHTVTKAG